MVMLHGNQILNSIHMHIKLSKRIHVMLMRERVLCYVSGFALYMNHTQLTILDSL